jgi:hypothetical protein
MARQRTKTAEKEKPTVVGRTGMYEAVGALGRTKTPRSQRQGRLQTGLLWGEHYLGLGVLFVLLPQIASHGRPGSARKVTLSPLDTVANLWSMGK